MTKRKKAMPPTLSQSLVWTLAIMTLFLILYNPGAMSSALREAITVCTDCLIPSILPFLFFSQILLQSNFGDFCADWLGGITKRLFHLPAVCAVCLFLALGFGFPSGIQSILSLYDNHSISEKEAERLLGLCSVPGPAFIIGTVGQTLLGSRRLGIFLYGILILSVLGIGLLTRPGVSSPSKPSKCASANHLLPIGQLTARAVSAASRAMMMIILYYLFFTCLDCAFSPCLSLLPPFLQCVVFSTAELSTGLLASSALGGSLGCLCAGFGAGFGSLSVMLQVKALCGDRHLSLRSYFFCRLALGGIAGLSLWLSYPLIKLQTAACSVFLPVETNLSCGFLALFLLVLGSCLKKA